MWNVLKYFLLAVVGIGLLVGAAFVYVDTKAFEKRANKTTAVIQDVRSEQSVRYTKRGRRTDTDYYRTVSFTTEIGNPVVTEMDGSSSDRIGQYVDVLYDRENPLDVRKPADIWWLAILLTVGGVAALMFGTVGMVIMNRGNNATRRASAPVAGDYGNLYQQPTDQTSVNWQQGGQQ